MVIALAVQKDLKLHQMDVTIAFLNGELKDNNQKFHALCLGVPNKGLCQISKPRAPPKKCYIKQQPKKN